MLPAASRLRSHADFRATVGGGVRVGSSRLVVHLRRGGADGSRAGLVVSKAVGNAVTRNRVKRQIRHSLREPLASAPFVVDVVVRALPSAARGVASAEVSEAFDRAVGKLVRL